MRLFLIAFVAGISFSFSAQAMIIACDGHEKNLETFLEMTRVIWNDRDETQAHRFYPEEFISHNSDDPNKSTNKRNLDEMKRMWIESKQREPVRTLTTDVVVCNGDYLVAHVTTEGTRVEGSMAGDVGEGRKYRVSSIEIYRFEDGKIAERWAANDSISLIRQLGLELDLSYRPLKE